MLWQVRNYFYNNTVSGNIHTHPQGRSQEILRGYTGTGWGQGGEGGACQVAFGERGYEYFLDHSLYLIKVLGLNLL